MIEALISITISLLLLAGVMQIFITSKKGYLLESAYTNLQENGRFSTQFLSQLIRLSGYRTPPNSSQFIDIKNIFDQTAPFISVQNGSGANNSDTLTLRFQGSGDGAGTPDNNIRDCLNQPLDADTIATNTLSINNNLELECQANNPNASPQNSTITLIEGVEKMRILLGEDLDGDGSANRYVPANFTNLNPDNIVSIRVGLLIRSLENVNPNLDTNTYNIIGTTFTPTPDRKLRKIFTFTVQLRNT